MPWRCSCRAVLWLLLGPWDPVVDGRHELLVGRDVGSSSCSDGENSVPLGRPLLWALDCRVTFLLLLAEVPGPKPGLPCSILCPALQTFAMQPFLLHSPSRSSTFPLLLCCLRCSSPPPRLCWAAGCSSQCPFSSHGADCLLAVCSHRHAGSRAQRGGPEALLCSSAMVWGLSGADLGALCHLCEAEASVAHSSLFSTILRSVILDKKNTRAIRLNFFKSPNVAL